MLRDKVLRPVYPNAGLEAEYRRRLQALVEEMANSVSYWVLAKYRAETPEIVGIDPADGVLARDESPAAALSTAVKELSSRWQARFDEAARDLANYFAKAAADRSDRQLRAILKKSGFSVKFKMTRPMNDVVQASVQENVQLIKSIPQQYLTQVQGYVMRSVQTGRDLGQLSQDLQGQLGVTKRRAATIALDQNNKATAAFTRVRQTELGITEAVWKHSHAGKTPRPSHVKMDGKKYKIADGMYDPDVGRNVLPGELVNCRCTSRSVIPAFA